MEVLLNWQIVSFKVKGKLFFLLTGLVEGMSTIIQIKNISEEGIVTSFSGRMLFVDFKSPNSIQADTLKYGYKFNLINEKGVPIVKLNEEGWCDPSVELWFLFIRDHRKGASIIKKYISHNIGNISKENLFLI